ncbi:MAG: ferredoxin [Acidobacteriota bacterium]
MEGIGHLINYTVDKETCIGCRACAEGFPAQFVMNDDENKAYTTGISAGTIDWREPVIACPVDSIAVVDFRGRLLLDPQGVRDEKPLPEAAVTAMVKEFEALPPEEKHVIEIKTPVGTVSKVEVTEPGQLPEKWFSQFSTHAAMKEEPAPARFKPWVKRALALTQPLWGAFSDRWKTRMVELSGEDPAISPGTATTLNAIMNFGIYSAGSWFVFAHLLDVPAPLVIGGSLAFAFGEFAFRLKDEIFDWGITERDRVYPAAAYLAPFSGTMVRLLERLCASPSGQALVYARPPKADALESEREKLYGRAVTCSKLPEGGVQIEVEFPSKLQLSTGQVVNLPDYVTDVASRDQKLVLRAWLADPSLEALWSYRDPFPLSFEREIVFPGNVKSVEQERLAKKLRLRVQVG